MVGGSHSRSDPARRASHGSQAVVSVPVLTCTRGGSICTAAMTPKRIRFSNMRERAAKSFMALMVRVRGRERSFDCL